MNANYNKWIARALILALLNPAIFISPVFARDTEIYSGVLSASTVTVKPNVLFVLDTSDSMNLPEAWKEYEGAYDSHVEYLWNDLAKIVDADAGTAGEATTADPGRISTEKIPSVFFTKWGFWHGETLAERRALWQAARASAKDPYPGDTAKRYEHRNYDDLSWIYWLPAGTDEADPRLRAPSWNKFRGYIKELGNGVGGGLTRGGPSFMDTADFRGNNRCANSLDSLTPSTVFVPSSTARNTGKYLDQQWARWDPYLQATPVGNAGYPGSSSLTAALGTATQYAKGYLDTTLTSTGNPAVNPVYRDNSSGGSNPGDKGLPIRYNDGSGGAGWDGLRADAGGFIFRSIVDAYLVKADLETVMSWYYGSSPPYIVSDVDASGTADIKDAKFVAWKGATGLPFGKTTGLRAYTDTTAATCNSATGPASATCLDKPSGITTADITLTKTATCNLTGTTTSTDARGNPRKTGGSCTIGTITPSGDTNGSSYPNYSDVPSPTICPAPTTSNLSFYTEDNSACAYTVTTVAAAQTCALTGNQTLTVAACTPTGGSNVVVNSCTLGGPSDTVANCAWSGRQTKNVGTCAWVGRTAGYFGETQKWRASGGSCQQNGTTEFCSGTAGSIGPFATETEALASNTGCANTVAPSSYQYGGTCTENSSTEECVISGGTSVLGAGYTNVNATCGNANSPPPGSYTHTPTCTESGSASSCNLSAGTSRTIRGSTKTYYTAANCTNKANALPTINQGGSYSHGQTCTGANNVCTPNATSSFTVRGTNYTRVTSCNSARPSGTYNRGGTCSGSLASCAQVTPYGGTSISVPPNTWYTTLATCTPPVGAQTYNSDCTGTKRLPPGTPAATTTNTQAACNFTKNTNYVINGNTYTHYTSCTDKADINPGCNVQFPGSSCRTGCGAATPTSVTGGATSQSHNYYRVYNFQASTDHLVHDCKADDAGTKFMHFAGGTLATFGNAWSDTNSYAASAGGGVAVDNAQKVDMYSVNYLNWKYGPRGPGGHPIGRKTRLQIAKDALATVIVGKGSIGGLAKPTAAETQLRLGVMAFNQMQKSPMDSSGAHLVKAVDDLTTAHGDEVIKAVNALTASSATPLTESVYEAYLYFKGAAPKFGYMTNESVQSTGSPLLTISDGADASTKALSGGLYKSPIFETCSTNMVILISDGAPENDTAADADILALPDSGVVSILQPTATGQFEVSTGVPYGPPDTEGPPQGTNYILLDELAYYMSHVDARPSLPGEQRVLLTTISYDVVAPVMDKATQAGGGVPNLNANNEKKLVEALLLSVDVPPWQPQGGAPASTFNIGNGLSGDIYLAAFSPTYRSSWGGTIKKYKYGFGKTVCGDVACGNPDVCITGNPAITYGSCGTNVEVFEAEPALKDESGNDLRLRKIRSEAVSYWIPTSPADGGSGLKGGTGQVLISSGAPNTRKLYTFIAAVSPSPSLVDPKNRMEISNPDISKTVLGNPGMSDAERDALISFAQGSDGTNVGTWRDWAHFDSLHSSPLVDGDDLYYLTSDGVLHSVNTLDGKERWAFMVEEGLSQISAYKAGANGERLEVADGTPVMANLPDGKKILIFGLRRGGRAYYALDVTNQNAPAVAWKISPTQSCVGLTCSASTDYSELGQAWSTPVVGKVRGYKDSSPTPAYKPVLIFGGGYDENQDSLTPVADTMGRAVFVADAATGKLVRKFSTVVSGQGYSVPADVLAIDTTGDWQGTIDRVYVGDMGGRLWRMDLDDRSTANRPEDWTIVQLANLRTSTRPNKLFNRPTMAPSSYQGQKFDAVFVGGGDIQQPKSVGLNDAGAMYMVKDFAIAKVAVEASPIPNASTDFVDMTNVTDSAAMLLEAKKIELKNKSGFVFNLSSGEKVSSSAQVIGGILYFGTYFPPQDTVANLATSCKLGGYGKQFAMDALTGTALKDKNDVPYFAGGNNNGRVFGFVSGFGVALSPVTGGPGKGIFMRNRGVEAQQASKTSARPYWFSSPEQ